MKAWLHCLPLLRWIAALTAVLILASAACAQDNARVPVAILGGMLFLCVLLGLAAYIYMALALQTIANKTNTGNSWFAWIPILNLVLMLNVAKKPVWWILLCLIPLVNIVIFVLVWMGVAQARGKPDWWGILIIVPVANLIVPGYLAWAD